MINNGRYVLYVVRKVQRLTLEPFINFQMLLNMKSTRKRRSRMLKWGGRIRIEIVIAGQKQQRRPEARIAVGTENTRTTTRGTMGKGRETIPPNTETRGRTPRRIEGVRGNEVVAGIEATGTTPAVTTSSVRNKKGIIRVMVLGRTAMTAAVVGGIDSVLDAIN